MSNPLLDLIIQGESGAAGYNAYNRGTYVDENGGKHIRSSKIAIDFSSLTVREIHALQHLPRDDSHRVFAVGKYQVTPATMDDAIVKLNLDGSQPFTPTLQDQIFSEYLLARKRPDIHGYITGQQGVTVESAQRSLAAEWASFGDPDHGGGSHYGGANHASITLEQSSNALNQMRASYQADIARGLSPAEAWREVTASDHPSTMSRSHVGSASGQRQQQGDHGAGVSDLQTQLTTLGYRNSHGQSLVADGNFGPQTHTAVEAFQRDHQLAIDGKVGPQTRHVLGHALQATAQPIDLLLDDPNHPSRALYEQAFAEVRRIDATIGRDPDARSCNLAVALTVAAWQQDLTRIDRVALSESGEQAFVLQSGTHTKVACVQTAEAINSSKAKSTAAWQQAVQQPAMVSSQTSAQADPQQAAHAMER